MQMREILDMALSMAGMARVQAQESNVSLGIWKFGEFDTSP
jgi:hypothetical protein